MSRWQAAARRPAGTCSTAGGNGSPWSSPATPSERARLPAKAPPAPWGPEVTDAATTTAFDLLFLDLRFGPFTPMLMHLIYACHSTRSTRQGPLERTLLRGRLSTAIALQQLLRPPGQHAPDLSPLPLDLGNHHAVVAGGLMAHPGDHRRLGPLLDRDALRP